MRLLIPLALALLAAAPAAAAPDEAPLSRFLAAYDRARSWRGVIRVVTRHEGATSDMRMRLFLQKPSRTAFTILASSTKPGSVGTRIVWDGGPKAHVSTRFFGFPIKLKTAFDDARLRDMRGDTLWDLSIVKAVAIARDPATTIRDLGPDRHAGRAVRKVEVKSPQLLPGIDKEVFWLDAATDLPVVREMHAGREVAYRLMVESSELDPALPPETFRME